MNESLFKDIEPAAALGIEVARYEVGEIELRAPLYPNLNDKGTAFAGSISSILSLAGWGVITLLLKTTGIDADVMVVKSETDFSSPVTSELRATARLSTSTVEQMLNDLKNKRRSRVHIQSELFSDSNLCASMSAQYAVFLQTD
jgi:thioesterase domain-containing protein